MIDEDGQEVVVANGRYGPYMSKGEETRSLRPRSRCLRSPSTRPARSSPAEAVRAAAGRAQAAVRELGNDPVIRRPVVVKDGRFGPYVTDGETNASLARATGRGDHDRAGRRAPGGASRAGGGEGPGGQAGQELDEGGQGHKAAKPAKRTSGQEEGVQPADHLTGHDRVGTRSDGRRSRLPNLDPLSP